MAAASELFRKIILLPSTTLPCNNWPGENNVREVFADSVIDDIFGACSLKCKKGVGCDFDTQSRSDSTRRPTTNRDGLGAAGGISNPVTWAKVSGVK